MNGDVGLGQGARVELREDAERELGADRRDAQEGAECSAVFDAGEAVEHEGCEEERAAEKVGEI